MNRSTPVPTIWSSRLNTARTATAVAVAISATTLSATVLSTSAPAHADDSRMGQASRSESRSESLAGASTHVEVPVSNCEGCELTVNSYYFDGDQEQLWSSPTQTVDVTGRVSFEVPTEYTRGMSIALSAPWERRVGAAGAVVFRYKGLQPGQKVTTHQARQARRGIACYAGTNATQVTLKVKVHRAHFPGNGGRATAAAAHTRITQATEGLAERTYDGFYGTQDTPACSRS